MTQSPKRRELAPQICPLLPESPLGTIERTQTTRAKNRSSTFGLGMEVVARATSWLDWWDSYPARSPFDALNLYAWACNRELRRRDGDDDDGGEDIDTIGGRYLRCRVALWSAPITAPCLFDSTSAEVWWSSDSVISIPLCRPLSCTLARLSPVSAGWHCMHRVRDYCDEVGYGVRYSLLTVVQFSVLILVNLRSIELINYCPLW